MVLIAEIVLTVFAWRAGWKALALLPLGIGVAGGFVGGLFMGMTGTEDFLPALLLVDIGVLVALAIMIKKGRPTTATPTAEISATPATA